jgi:YidC/Oxa1 family membrane protein insertase
VAAPQRQQATFFPTPAKPAAGRRAGAAAGRSRPPRRAFSRWPPAGAASPAAARAADGAPAAPRERITVTTDVLRLTFDTEGGSLVRTELLKHAN